MSEAILNLPSGALSLQRVRVMGILNVTPDSFYDQGRYQNLDRATARAVEMADEGADLIEIGGEKAGPGTPVSVDEELRRVIPTIEAVKRELPLPISVDTFKPRVARAAMEAGADIVNSIEGLGDAEMRKTVRETGAGAVIMHIQGQPRVPNTAPTYHDVVAEVKDWLLARVETCLREGIEPGKIVIDPGPGFGKTTQQDLSLIRSLRRHTVLPYPVLLAVSRKKFIGDVLDLETDERLEGSLAVVAWAVLQGVRMVRVHDVRASVRVCRMTEAVLTPSLVQI